MKLSLPEKPPKPGSQSLTQLRELQRKALAAIRYPLSRSGRTQAKWIDGRPMRDVAAEFLKPNDRLTSVERLEIYNRQYWYRLLDCLWDDYPGLRAVLGLRKFEKLRIAYLDRFPSDSYSLRNLGSRLVEFLEEEPGYIAPNNSLCMDMARFEWAQVIAFDSEAKPPFTVDDLLGKDPGKLKVALQPYITLLELGYALDDYVLALKKRERAEASNAVEANRASEKPQRVRPPKPEEVFLTVHRFEDGLYYKRLEPEAFRVLTFLAKGASIAKACAAAIPDDDDRDIDWAAKIRGWFSGWMELGWICKRD